MQTRKYPRTMSEAFGPYTSNQLSAPKDTDYGWLWWASMVVISVFSVVLIVVTA